TVNNGDVYVIGTEKDPTTKNRVLKLWKNGQVTSLTEASNEATANDLIFFNGQLYILGDVLDSISNLGWQTKLWKDGVPSTLNSGSGSTISHRLYATNSDVY